MSAQKSEDRTQVRVGVSLVTAFMMVVIFVLGRSEAKDAALVVHVSPTNAAVELLEPRAEGEKARRHVAVGGVVRFGELPRGVTAKIKAAAPGYKQVVATQLLPAGGGEVTLAVNLTSETGLVTVRTNPADAMVYLDDKAAGVAPVVLTSVDPGAHRISARKLGFLPVTQTITVKPSETKVLELTLEPLDEKSAAEEAAEDAEKPPAGFGRMRIKSTHPVLCFVDNYKQPRAKNFSKSVVAGPHLVHCRCEGRGSSNRRVEIVEGETTLLEFDFSEDPIDKARRALDPNEPLYWVSKGAPTRNKGQYGDAVEMFQKAVDLDPDYAPAHRQLGYTLAPLKRWDEAIEALERYVELDENAPDRDFALDMIKVYEQKRTEEDK